MNRILTTYTNDTEVNNFKRPHAGSFTAYESASIPMHLQLQRMGALGTHANSSPLHTGYAFVARHFASLFGLTYELPR